MIAPFGPAHQEDSMSDEIDETRLEIYSKHWPSASELFMRLESGIIFE
jgi:hypothetical protein